MGFGSIGGSKSSKRTTNNNDNRALMAAGNTGQAVMGEGNTVFVNRLDGGAIGDAFEFGKSALAANIQSSNSAFEYASSANRDAINFASDSMSFTGGVTDRAFDAVDQSSSQAFQFVSGAFDSALEHSEAARAESFNAVSESNKRIDEAYAGYRASGRESAAESLSIIKVLALLVGVGVVVAGVRRG